MMANLVGKSGDNKGQYPILVEAICRDFRQHDKAEEDKYREWQSLSKTEPNNKKKTAEPTLAYWFPPVDTTKPAFLKNAIVLEAQGVARSTSTCLKWRWPTSCVAVTNKCR